MQKRKNLSVNTCQSTLYCSFFPLGQHRMLKKASFKPRGKHRMQTYLHSSLFDQIFIKTFLMVFFAEWGDRSQVFVDFSSNILVLHPYSGINTSSILCDYWSDLWVYHFNIDGRFGRQLLRSFDFTSHDLNRGWFIVYPVRCSDYRDKGLLCFLTNTRLNKQLLHHPFLS